MIPKQIPVKLFLIEQQMDGVFIGRVIAKICTTQECGLHRYLTYLFLHLEHNWLYTFRTGLSSQPLH